MRIALAVADLSVGGAERNVVNYALGLHQQGHEVIVLAGRGPLARELHAAGIEVWPFRSHLRRPFGLLRTSLRIGFRLRGSPVDVFHSFMASTSIVGVLARHFVPGRSYPIVTQVGGLEQDPGEPKLLWRGRLQVLAATSDIVLAPSSAIHRSLRSVGVPDRKILDVAFNTVSLQAFSAQADAKVVRSGLGWGPDDPLICSAARLHPLKRHDLLIRTVATVVAQAPRAHFVLIGDGPARPGLVQLASELGVLDRVTFLGERDDVPRLLGACDVVTQTTYGESGGGPGLVVLEAFAASKPVVAFGFPDLREAVGNSDAAIVVPEGDVDAFAHALISLLRDPARAADMGRRGRALVQERFSVERFISELERIYREAIRRRGH